MAFLFGVLPSEALTGISKQQKGGGAMRAELKTLEQLEGRLAEAIDKRRVAFAAFAQADQSLAALLDEINEVAEKMKGCVNADD